MIKKGLMKIKSPSTLKK